MTSKIIPVTEFIRNFGTYADLIPHIGELVLTREGKPFAVVKASPQEKNEKLLSFYGAWKGTKLDSDKLWKKVFKRRNRKKPIVL